jgi:hypothetical protein
MEQHNVLTALIKLLPFNFDFKIDLILKLIFIKI